MNLLQGWLTFSLITLVGFLNTYAYPTDNDNEINYDTESELSLRDLPSLLEYENEIPSDWPTSSELMPEKRGPCHGTACVYSHIGQKAGHSSLRRLKLTLLRECITDPLCFSAGRRKRSAMKKNMEESSLLRALARLRRT